MFKNNYNIKVFSADNIEKYGKQKHANKAILISMYSTNDIQAKVICTKDNGIQAIKFLRIDDIDRPIKGLNAISTEDAKSIAQFIEDCQRKFDFDTILVNCGAGQSRSAGIAAALMKYLYNDDTPIFDSPRYTPNTRCYRYLLNELYDREDNSNE